MRDFSQMSRGRCLVAITPRNTVSGGKTFTIPSCLSSCRSPSPLLFPPQPPEGRTCGSSLETFCWTRRWIPAWSNGRTGRRACSVSWSQRPWRSYGARKRTTAAWPTRNSAGPWGRAANYKQSTAFMRKLIKFALFDAPTKDAFLEIRTYWCHPGTDMSS